MMSNSIDELIRMDTNIYRLRIVWTNRKSEESSTIPMPKLDMNYEIIEPKIKQINIRYFEIDSVKKKITDEMNKLLVLNRPWMPKSFIKPLITKQIIRTSLNDPPSEWSIVYFNCDLRLWFISYTALILSNDDQNTDDNNNNSKKWVRGLISADIDVSRTDINQCDVPQDNDRQSDSNVVITLLGTHKCHTETSEVSLKSSKFGV